MTDPASLPPAYFDDLYARSPDPWNFAASDYERAKYDATLAALPRPRYAAGFEVGCSIGVLTRRLAGRCGALLAVDVAEAALQRARQRCADRANVTIRRMQVPEAWPGGGFDLIVLSEVLYYLSPAAVGRTAARVRASVRPGASVLLVHYVLPTDYPLSGDAASERFIAAAGLPVSRQARDREYRLDLLQA